MQCRIEHFPSGLPTLHDTILARRSSLCICIGKLALGAVYYAVQPLTKQT